jgi:pilus assembly protein CpaD
MLPQNRTITARFLLLAGMLLASGCDTTDASGPAELSAPLPPKRTKVELVTFDHDIHFARGAKAVAPGEAVGLASFLKSNAIGDNDTVTVGSPDGSSSLAAARQTAVLAALKNFHVHAVATADTAPASGSVRIHVSHAVVTAPRCPDWSKPEADEPTNAPSSNYGCSNEANLAAMVADPTDLIEGKASDKADGVALARGVDLYRSGNLSKTLTANSGYSTSGLSGTGGPGSSGSGGGGGQ